MKKKNKEVSELLKQINVLNRGWIKAGCWSIVSESEHTRKDGTKYLRQVERTVELKKRKKPKKLPRFIGHMPDSAATGIRARGKPGTKERIEALATHYQQTKDSSPFSLTEEEEVASLTYIIGHLIPEERSSQRNKVVDDLCGLSHEYSEPDIDIRSDV